MTPETKAHLAKQQEIVDAMDRLEKANPTPPPRLDTRPEDRRARARERWCNVCTRINFATWQKRNDRTRALLVEAESAWRWYVAWDSAVAR